MAKKKPQKMTVCLDFDGVIHSYLSGWKGEAEIPDPPVEGAKRAIRILRMDYEVKVFSTRCRTPEGLEAVKKWLKANDIEVDEVCDHKPPAIVYVDDRGVQFRGDWMRTVEEVRGFRHWLGM